MSSSSSSSLPDYYARLGVSPSATLTEIKRAYRRLARLYHPDLNGQAQDERIKLINEAYQILRDNLKRAAYDQLRADYQRAERIAEEIRRQQEMQQQEAKREPKMTWVEGIQGFMYELKKELRDS